MKAVSIKRISPEELLIVWDSGHESTYNLKQLRDDCPCASCSGETVLLHQYQPLQQQKDTPNKYELKRITLVGSYAIQIEWGDGHNSGIYSWEYLFNHCISKTIHKHKSHA